tara:strand:- start:639 stop:980 length:342 start_codon:yes stop_codon:yes gene_type:complete
MKDRYPDHSANERTFLAWIRTALAIVGFGILVTKLGDQSSMSSGIGPTGLSLLALGMAVIIAAGFRFFVTRKHIDRDELDSTSPVILDVSLVITLILLFATLIGFGTHIAVQG